jgi:hypothetical protein
MAARMVPPWKAPRRRVRQEQHCRGERRRDRYGKQCRRDARDRGRTFRRGHTLAGAKARRCTKQQHAAQAAPDCCLGQRHVNGCEAHPDERQHRAECDEAYDRGKGRARSDRPAGHGCRDRGEAAIESKTDRHGCGIPRRAPRAMSWATVAPASCTRSQTMISFSAPNGPSVCGNNPSTTRPSPRLSALVSACRRVRGSGKRSNPTVPQP